MGEKMVGRDKINIVNIFFLNENCQPLANFVNRESLADSVAGNLVVLAKLAFQGTAAEEHGSRTIFSGKRRFFTKMRLNGGDS